MTAAPHHTTRRGFLGAGAAAAAAALGAPEAAFGADRPNVILIVVDTLRADHVYGDRARTPNMDALVRDGHPLHARPPGGDAHGAGAQHAA